MEIELIDGPLDGHRIDLPEPGCPETVLHYGRQYIRTGQTAADGTPCYVYTGEVERPLTATDRREQI